MDLPKARRARYLLCMGTMSEWKPLHQEAESLVRAAAELATVDDELAALRSEMTELDGPARRRVSFIVTTAALFLLSAGGIALWLLGVAS